MNIINAVKYSGPIIKSGIILKSPGVFLNYLKFLTSDISKFHVNYQPVGAIFYPTNRCNSKCKICPRNIEKLKPMFPEDLADIQFDKFKKMLDKLKKTVFIAFVGLGEPLLNKDIYEMMGYAGRKNKLVTVLTNGILLNKENIEKIISSEIYCIRISLYGTNANEFKNNTGLEKKMFHQVIENIKNLIDEKNKKKSKMEIHISYVVSRNNLKKMEDVINLTSGWGIDHISFSNYYPANPRDPNELKKMFFEGDQEAIEEINRLKKIKNSKVTFPVFIKKNNFNHNCPYTRKIIYLDANGNIGACNYIPPNKKFGNIFEEKDFFNSQHFLTARKIRCGNTPPYRCRFCREFSI